MKTKIVDWEDRTLEAKLTEVIADHDCTRTTLVSCMKHNGNFLLYCTKCNSELLTWKLRN